MRIQRTGEWLAAKIGDELVMMSSETGHYVGLSPTGARIWELLESSSDLDAICARLTEEFDVTMEQARTEVTGFLEELAKHGAVALRAPAFA